MGLWVCLVGGKSERKEEQRKRIEKSKKMIWFLNCLEWDEVKWKIEEKKIVYLWNDINNFM